MNSALTRRWRRNWMKLAHGRLLGGLATRLAALGLPPHTGRVALARLHGKGYQSASARLAHPGLVRGRNCFIGDGVMMLRENAGGDVVLGDRVQLHENNTLQTGQEGSIRIGADTHVQPRCQFSAYKGAIQIGERVEIAPSCAFYPYNHGTELGTPVRDQPLTTRGGIVVEDDAWLGYGVILLDGAHVGRGAVVAAGAVVTGPIPDNAIAGGVPARVLGMRQ